MEPQQTERYGVGDKEIHTRICEREKNWYVNFLKLLRNRKKYNKLYTESNKCDFNKNIFLRKRDIFVVFHKK